MPPTVVVVVDACSLSVVMTRAHRIREGRRDNRVSIRMHSRREDVDEQRVEVGGRAGVPGAEPVTNSPTVTPVADVVPVKNVVLGKMMTSPVPSLDPASVMLVALTAVTLPLARPSSTVTRTAVGVASVGSSVTTTFSPTVTPVGATGVPVSRNIVVDVVSIVFVVPLCVVMAKLSVPTVATTPCTV